MNSLESRFRQTKRTHTFLERIARVPSTLEPETSTPSGVKPRTNQHGIPLDMPELEPSRPPIEVLSDLREGWLASEETPPEPDGEAPAQKRQKSRAKKQKPIANYADFIESMKTAARKKTFSAAMRYDPGAESELSGAKLALLMIAILIVLLGIGALICGVPVKSLFQPGSFRR